MFGYRNKFKILKDDYKLVHGTTAYRIQALKDFGDVKEGDLGGYINHRSNLAMYGDSWVYDNATVIDNAKVRGDAKIHGNAIITGNACIWDNAEIFDNSFVGEEAIVSRNARVRGDALIFGNARVKGKAEVSDFAIIHGNALIHGKSKISGGSNISGSTEVKGNANIYLIPFVNHKEVHISNGLIKGNTNIRGLIDIKDNVVFSLDAFINSTILDFVHVTGIRNGETITAFNTESGNIGIAFRNTHGYIFEGNIDRFKKYYSGSLSGFPADLKKKFEKEFNVLINYIEMKLGGKWNGLSN